MNATLPTASGLWRRFHDFVLGWEERAWSPAHILLALAGLIAIRNALELTVGRNPGWELLAGFVHYPLAYLGPFRSQRAARVVMEAIWDAVPIRRCSGPPGRRSAGWYLPANENTPRGGPCLRSAAETP